MNLPKSFVAVVCCVFIPGLASAQTFNQTFATQIGAVGNITDSAAPAPDDLASFNTELTTANGGVFDITSSATFTNGTTVFTGTTSHATPAALKLTFSRAMQLFNNGATYTASSGTRGVTTQSTAGDYSFTVGPVMDGANPTVLLDGYHVTSLGFAAMSRTNAAGETAFPLDLKATVGLSSGYTMNLVRGLSGTRGNNVFFGFTAPAGTAIISVKLEAFEVGTQTPVVARIGLDDIALIVRQTGPLAQPPTIEPVTADGSYIPPGGQFSFRVVSTENVPVENISVSLNGGAVTPQVAFSGTPTDRTVTLSNLPQNTALQAAVTITATSGIANRTFTFTTVEPAPTIYAITEDGAYLRGTSRFELGVSSLNTPMDASKVTLALNGANITPTSVFGGTPLNRNINFRGLTPNSVNQLVVSATNNSGQTSTRTLHFLVQGEALAVADFGGFEDEGLFPLGPLQAVGQGYARWVPSAAELNKMAVATADEPYGRVLYRMQGGGDRADYLHFPPVSSGVLRLSFDARVSATNHRTLDVCVQPDVGSNTTMAGFLQWGRLGERLTYYDNTSYIELSNFTLDTEWHHYEMVHYFEGPKERTYDLLVDGQIVGAGLPWRHTNFSDPLRRVRFQTIARDIPLDETGIHSSMEIDNVRILVHPPDIQPLRQPVAVNAVAKGVTYRRYDHQDVYASNQVVHVVEVNLDDPAVGLAFPQSGATRRTVQAHAATVPGAVAAVNAQFFNTSGSIQYFRVGGTLINPTVSAQDQQAIADDGLALPDSIRVIPKPAAGWESASQSSIMATGPLLIQAGRKWTAYDPADTDFVPVRHPRTAAAWTYDNRLLLVAVDGRSTSAAGMTIPELRDYIGSLGWVKNAVNYDGGGSTTMWTSSGLMNSPSDGSMRPVPNAIAITSSPVVVPAAPTGIVGVVAGQGYMFHWQHSSGATTYEIRRAEAPGGPFVTIGTTGQTTFTDATAETGVAYHYVIIAKNSAGDSPSSEVFSIGEGVTPPIAPATAITMVGDEVAITFLSEEGRSYRIEHSTSLQPDSWVEVGEPEDGTGQSMTLTAPMVGNVSFYRIRME